VHKGRSVKKVMLVLVLMVAFVQAQEESTVASCSLYVKTSIYPYDYLAQYGHGKVEARLCDKKGVAIPFQEIRLTATCGRFCCTLPDLEGIADSASRDSSCYITAKDGRIVVYLLDIPFNTSGKVLAACTYGDMSVKAASTFWVKRFVKKGSQKKKPSVQFRQKRGR
jgi:hypothetical protein